MTRTDDWRKWIADHAPVPLLTHAHEVFLAVAVLLIAGGLVVGDLEPGSVHSQVPDWQATSWGWSLAIGSTLTLWGLFRDHPRAEWAGQLVLGWGTFFYSLALYTAGPFTQTGVAALIFLGLATVSWWRAWKITSQPYIQHRLVKEARAAHFRVHDKGEA